MLKQRYYRAALQRDLLGDLIVTQIWGGIGSRRGGQRSHFCQDVAQAQQYLLQLARRRQQHGYLLKETL